MYYNDDIKRFMMSMIISQVYPWSYEYPSELIGTVSTLERLFRWSPNILTVFLSLVK